MTLLPSSRLQRRNFLFGVGNGIVFNLTFPLFDATLIIPLLMSHLTDSSLLVGLAGALLGIGWFAPQLPAARWIATSNPRMKVYRRVGMVRVAGVLIMAGCLALVPVPHGPGVLAMVLLGLALFALAGGVAGAAFMDIVAAVVAPGFRGRFFGARKLIGGLGVLIITPGVAWTLDHQGYPRGFAWVFGLAALLVALGVELFCRIREEPPPPVLPPEPLSRYIPRALADVAGHPDLRRLLVIRGWVALWSWSFPFYILLARESLGLTDGMAALLILALQGGRILSNPLWAYLSDVRGNRLLLLVCLPLGLPVPLLGLLGGTLGTLGFGSLFLLLGAVQTGLELGYTNYLLEVADPDNRPAIIGLVNSLSGLLVLSPILGGWVLDRWGWPALLLGATLGIVVAVALVPGLGKVRGVSPSRDPGASGAADAPPERWVPDVREVG